MKLAVSKTALFAAIVLFSTMIGSGCSTGTSNSDKATESLPAPSPTSTPRIFEKLVGTWQNKDNGEFERWTKNADGSFQSVVFHIKNGDTLFTEQANVYREDSIWIFENVVKDQNAGKAVKFPATIVGETNVQFSNPAHDFPTEVNYSIPNDSTVNAFISGMNAKGTKDTIPFNYKRVRT